MYEEEHKITRVGISYDGPVWVLVLCALYVLAWLVVGAVMTWEKYSQ